MRKFKINVDNRFDVDENGNLFFSEDSKVDVCVCWDEDTCRAWLEFDADEKTAKTDPSLVIPNQSKGIYEMIDTFISEFAYALREQAKWEATPFWTVVDHRVFVSKCKEVASWVIRPYICNVMDKKLKEYSL